jgi:DNA repair photolyase
MLQYFDEFINENVIDSIKRMVKNSIYKDYVFKMKERRFKKLLKTDRKENAKKNLEKIKQAEKENKLKRQELIKKMKEKEKLLKEKQIKKIKI